ncbi:unnamed protein product [Mytilus coruscus]|uniref:Reverse transcriptase domain-containing protein n=1 Tax=Mytilus coruscus TaxID=42192 RepID=A0A6J8C2Q5_MYTCO|nr:unnamed protein product [Mytilus coruscus]
MSEKIDRFIPKKKTDRKFISPPLWMDRATKSAIVKKRKSWKNYKYSRNNLSYAKYVKDRNECTYAVRNSKLIFEQKVALESKTNVKSFWNNVNSTKLKTRSGIGTLEKPDGTLASSTSDKVEVLNQFFTVEGIVKSFANDFKVYSKVSSDNERCKLQEKLDSLYEWSDTWKLKCNAAKCKVLHITCNPDNDQQYRYTMLDESENFIVLSRVNEEKDLGVTFESNLKFEKHISNIVNKAQRVLSLIHHSFDYMDQDMCLTLYKSPHLKKDIRKLESVQRRATKLVKNINHLSYEDRLRSLGLPTLEYRRDRNDMIQVYKALHGIDDINWMSLFTLAPSNYTTGHSLKLFKKQCKTTHRLNTFSIRVVDQWNNLSDLTVTAKTLNNFKSALNGENWNPYEFICSC